MKTSLTFDKALIAPCGMNCGTCIAFLRDKNKCYGCRIRFADKQKSCSQCIVKNCIQLAETTSNFCYECKSFPCKRLKQLDKRYRTKYRTSFIENLMMIKEKGITKFLKLEAQRRSCPDCGSVVSVHRNKCSKCSYEIAEG